MLIPDKFDTSQYLVILCTLVAILVLFAFLIFLSIPLSRVGSPRFNDSRSDS